MSTSNDRLGKNLNFSRIDFPWMQNKRLEICQQIFPEHIFAPCFVKCIVYSLSISNSHLFWTSPSSHVLEDTEACNQIEENWALGVSNLIYVLAVVTYDILTQLVRLWIHLFTLVRHKLDEGIFPIRKESMERSTQIKAKLKWKHLMAIF